MKLRYALLVFLVAASALALFSCTSGEPSAKSRPGKKFALKNFEWLLGRWQKIEEDGTAFEEWSVTDGNHLSGSAGMVKHPDTTISEIISLEQKGELVYYTPTVVGQNDGLPVSFVLVAAAGDSFVFENMSHDFPQQITYKRIGSDSLVASISGEIDGQIHLEFFPLKRVVVR